MSYKTIDETFWTDPDVKKKLSPNEKLLFLYLITNPHCHYSGIYYLPVLFILNETGLSEKIIHNFFMKNQKLAQYDQVKEVVWVVSMSKHQLRQGNKDNLIAGIAKHLTTLHYSLLIKSFLDKYMSYNIPFSIPSGWDTQPMTIPSERVGYPIPESVTGTGSLTGTEVFCSERTSEPSSANLDLDPDLKKILVECPHLSLISSGQSSEFWDQVLAACEPYPVADGKWLNAKIRSWNHWFTSNPSRKSRDRKKLESRILSWLSKDLERLARTGGSR